MGTAYLKVRLKWCFDLCVFKFVMESRGWNAGTLRILFSGFDRRVILLHSYCSSEVNLSMES